MPDTAAAAAAASSPQTSIRAVRDRLVSDGVILCIRQDDAARAAAGCAAAIAGGLRTIEVTLTTPGALDLIAALAPREDLLVGAGTVLDPDQVDAVAEAGGRFALSPVLDREVLERAAARGLLAIPGAATPTEILAARRAGAELVKFFPSGALGGPAALRAIRGPLPDIPLVPTSGPTSDDIGAWVAAGATAVGVGGEVLGPGWTPASAAEAAARIRQAFDAARASAGTDR